MTSHRCAKRYHFVGTVSSYFHDHSSIIPLKIKPRLQLLCHSKCCCVIFLNTTQLEYSLLILTSQTHFLDVSVTRTKHKSTEWRLKQLGADRQPWAEDPLSGKTHWVEKHTSVSLLTLTTNPARAGLWFWLCDWALAVLMSVVIARFKRWLIIRPVVRMWGTSQNMFSFSLIWMVPAAGGLYSRLGRYDGITVYQGI